MLAGSNQPRVNSQESHLRRLAVIGVGSRLHAGWPILAAAGLAYVVMIGGGTLGDTDPTVRLATAFVAAPTVVAYVLFAPSRGDNLDRWILAALLLFLSACVLSTYPRQSLESALIGFGTAAALFCGRQLLRRVDARNVFAVTLIALSLAVTLVALGRWLPMALEWWNLNDRRFLPPLDLALPSAPWGHRHDLALLVGMLYPSWWLNHPGRARAVVAVVMGVVVSVIIVLDGSRTLWLAVGAATVVLIGPSLRATLVRLPRLVLGGAAAGFCAVLFVSGAADTLLQRVFNLDTLAARAAMWGPILELWSERPVQGWGPGAFPWLLQRTEYFDTNSWAPLHPDSVVFQVLPEAGLLGLGAITLAALAIGLALRRSRSNGARWVTVAFAVAGVGANPTDFSFLVLLAAAWVAYGLPAERSTLDHRTALSRSYRVGAPTGLAVIAACVVMASGGAFYYVAARAEVQNGNLAGARDSLSAAIALDPGMALYWRQRGVVDLVTDGAPTGVPDLETATALNPSDDVAWRALAMSYRMTGDHASASRALEQAVSIQRADPANLLLRLHWLVEESETNSALSLLAYVVRTWPTVTGAPGWRDVLGTVGADPRAVYAAAASLWEDRTDAPSGDTTLLSVLASDPRLLTSAPDTAWVRASYDCGDRASAPDDWDRRQPHLWAASIRGEAWQGRPPPDKVRIFQLMTGYSPPPLPKALNPVNDTPLYGFSADIFGYRRLPIEWPASMAKLPSPDAGADRWLLDPAAAHREAGLRCP